MPKIVKQFTLDIPVQRFVNACSDDEIYELWLLLSSPRYQSIIAGKKFLSSVQTPVKPVLNKVALPFQSDRFAKAWEAWKEYKKKEFGFRYKSLISERTALNDLVKKSKNNEQIAIEMLRVAIAKGWRGFFPIKDDPAKPPVLTRKNFG